ncbi:HepT-like ribonuclease domain-containing protein [Photorhabdus bodei]
MDELAFLNNQLVQDAVIRNFEIIGEASNNIGKHYPNFAVANPELPLSFAYLMRNALAHGYFKVDFEIVWKTIHSALQCLRISTKFRLIKNVIRPSGIAFPDLRKFQIK